MGGCSHHTLPPRTDKHNFKIVLMFCHMAKKQKDEPKVNIDGKEYKVADLSPEQVDMVNHVADLDNKLRSASFNVVQLQGGRNYFMEMLNASLESG